MNQAIEKESKSDVQVKKDTVLFVCTGNTCRSPMCAALFNHKYAGLTRVGLSAGLCASGRPISSNAAFVLREYGVKSSGDNDYNAHISRNVTEELMKEADLVVAVSSQHALALISRFPAYASKITSFPKDIFDPVGGDEETYRFCLKLIDKALCRMFSEDKNGFEDSKSDDK